MKKKSLFERLTGSVGLSDNFDDDDTFDENPVHDDDRGQVYSPRIAREDAELENESIIEDDEDGQLAVDVYQTPSEIVVQTFTAGVRPESLTINITRNNITIKGRREENRTIRGEDYFTQELYWGTFSRTILLPEEVDPDAADAVEKHGLLIIKLPKINKDKATSLRVKSV